MMFYRTASLLVVFPCLAMAACLNCADSCVRLENGSDVCVGFERYVTRVLSEGGTLMEFDSTDYDMMEALTGEINARTKDVGVRLLGSATSVIVDRLDLTSLKTPWMEVTNLTYAENRWNVSIVAADGLLFISAAGYNPGMSFELNNNAFTVGFGTKSVIVADGMGRAAVALHEADLISFGFAQDDNVFFEANFSVGVATSEGFTQTPICVKRAKGAVGTSVESFKRQVAPYVMMQLEQNASQIYARLWAQCTLVNATVVYVQYAWEKEGVWKVPTRFDRVSECPFVEIRVPVNDWASTKGNFTLYVVVQQDQVMARILTQARSLIVNAPQPPLHVGIEIEVLQGLQLASVYRGPVAADGVFINNTDVDALLTFVARSSGPLVINSLVAIHTHTETQRAAVIANDTCDGCVVEQLVMQGRVLSPRSCHITGVADDLDWIEGYVGLVGSSLAADVMQRTLALLQNQTRLVIWINPVWPWGNDTVVEDVTFIRASIEQGMSDPNKRRLLWDSSGSCLQSCRLTLLVMCLMLLTQL